MDVVRHDDERNHRHTFAFEMPECFRHDLGAIRSSQKTRAVSGVEPLLDRAGETLVIFALDFDIPRFGMHTQPGLALILPLIAQARWDGIR